MAKYDHYEKYEWLGTFWTPDKSIEFPGKLTYSPEDGIELDFLYPMGKKVHKTEYIYGDLSTGEPCTLYGLFNPENFGFYSGKISIYKGKISFHMILFGENSTPDTYYDGAWLDFTNFQEFCYPQGLKDFAKYQKDFVQNTKKEELNISITNSGRFKFFSDNFKNMFHSNNEDVAEEINKIFSELKNKFPHDDIHAITDIGWLLQIQSNARLSVNDIVKHVYAIENLISLLIYSPVRRKEISIMKKSISMSDKFESLPLLTSLFDMSKYKIEVLKTTIIHQHLPITPRNSNFTEIYAKWLDAEEGFYLFSNLISNNFGKLHKHEIYAEIVLALTQLEAISYSFGKKSKDKYMYAIKKYADSMVVVAMKHLFGVNEDENLGECLSDLRAEIAHIGKPQKYLKELDVWQLYRIAKCIKIVITSHIYESLGISAEKIKEFQKIQMR